jgi:hypothetical protein
MARYDDLNTGAIAYSTFVGAVLLLIIILLGRALTYAWIESEDARKMANASYTAADQEINDQRAELAGYRTRMVQLASGDEGSDVEPEEKELLVIPIERAKELVLEEVGESPQT